MKKAKEAKLYQRLIGELPSALPRKWERPASPKRAIDVSYLEAFETSVEERAHQPQPLFRHHHRSSSLYTFDEVDVTGLDTIRQKDGQRTPFPLSLLPYVVKAATETLRQFPQFTATVDGTPLTSVGVLFDTDAEQVPVLTGVCQKSHFQLGRELADLFEKVCSGSLKEEDSGEASFTIADFSTRGSHFTPRLAYPETAVLGVGRVREKPVVKEGNIVIRKMLPLSFGFDHRVHNSADAAAFVQAFRHTLEHPEQLFSPMAYPSYYSTQSFPTHKEALECDHQLVEKKLRALKPKGVKRAFKPAKILKRTKPLKRRTKARKQTRRPLKKGLLHRLRKR